MLLVNFKIEKISRGGTPFIRVSDSSYECAIPYPYKGSIDQAVVDYFWNKKGFKDCYVGCSIVNQSDYIFFENWDDAIKSMKMQQIS